MALASKNALLLGMWRFVARRTSSWRLATATGDETHRERARQLLAAIATPAALASQGRLLGGFLLAAEEAGVLR